MGIREIDQEGLPKKGPHVEYYQDGSGEWRWRKRAANGEIVSTSGEGYVNRADVLEAIDREHEGMFRVERVME